MNSPDEAKELLQIYRELYEEMAAQDDHIDPATGKELMLVTSLRERIERLSQWVDSMGGSAPVGLACPSNATLH